MSPPVIVTALPAEVRAAIVRAYEAIVDGDVGYALEILAALEEEYAVPVNIAEREERLAA